MPSTNAAMPGSTPANGAETASAPCRVVAKAIKAPPPTRTRGVIESDFMGMAAHVAGSLRSLSPEIAPRVHRRSTDGRLFLRPRNADCVSSGRSKLHPPVFLEAG